MKKIILIILTLLHSSMSLTYKDMVDSDKETMSLAEIKNVLLVGLSQSGKTSLKNFLLSTSHNSTYSEGFSLTAKPYITTMASGELVINLIDTPGFAEELMNSKEKRNSKKLSEIIRNITLLELSYIHQVWVTIDISAKMSREIKDSITDVLMMFKGLESVITPVFTKAQLLSKDHLARKIKSWITHFKKSGLKLNWNSWKVFGGLDHNHFSQQKNSKLTGEPMEVRQHQSSKKWRTKLLESLKTTKSRMSVFCLEDLEGNVEVGTGGIWSWIKSVKEWLVGDTKERCSIDDNASRFEEILPQTGPKVDLTIEGSDEDFDMEDIKEEL